MFKEFWEKKKGLIECTAFLVATGALFLNIPLPEMEVARASLLKVQLIWLFLVTLSVAILAWHFWDFTLNIERRIEERFSLGFSAFSSFFFWLAAYLLWHLWKYMIILYEAEWKWFSVSVLYFLYVGYIYVLAHTVLWLERKAYRLRTFVLYSLGMCMLFAVIPTIYLSLVSLNGSFLEIQRIFNNLALIHIFLLGVFLIYRHFRKPSNPVR